MPRSLASLRLACALPLPCTATSGSRPIAVPALHCLTVGRCIPLALSQVVEVLYDAAHKQKWLLDRLQGFIDEGDVLIFANQKARVDELCAALQAAGARCAAVAGEGAAQRLRRK